MVTVRLLWTTVRLLWSWMVTVRSLLDLAVLSRGSLAVLRPFSVLSSRPILCHLDSLEDRLLLMQIIRATSVRHRSLEPFVAQSLSTFAI